MSVKQFQLRPLKYDEISYGQFFEKVANDAGLTG
jgi:hypothetical protein